MYFIYTLLLYLISPFILFRLFWKSKKLKAYRQRLNERFSFGRIVSPPVDVWLHAVSLGEVVAAVPFIERLLEKQLKVLVTTMTPTGSEQVRRSFGERVFHQYIPYDFPSALRRFFKKIKPRVGIIMETEIWPNLIREATCAKIPLFLVNARISDKAYPKYHRMRGLLKQILKQYVFILAQSPLDAERFMALGAAKESVKVMGNMKFDLKVLMTQEVLVRSMKQSWGVERPVFMLASTHHDEESQILNHLEQLRAQIPNLLILIAPRHPQRFPSVFEWCEQQGFHTGRRSDIHSITSSCEVIVLDSLGELLSFYAVSDYAFVGGSLVPIGGHNVLEPIALKVPVFCGPYMHNSQSIMNELLAARAITQVKDAEALIASISQFHHNAALKNKQVALATQILEANQGCVEKYFQLISQYAWGTDSLDK